MKTFQVGKIRDAHGLKGEVFVMLFSGESDWLPKLKVANFRGPKGDMKSLTVRSMRAHRNQGRTGLILASAELADRTAAEGYKGYVLEIPQDYLISETGEQPFLQEFLDMRVEDSKLGVIGQVVDFSSNGAQDLLIVKGEKASYEIPLVEDFVENVDFDQLLLKLNLPDGLLETQVASS